VPILAGRRVVDVRGRARVDAVALDDGRTLACDTVVFTGDWIPEHELARRAGLTMDAGTRGPAVDQHGRTSAPGVFAAGNLVHAAETADVAARGGRLAAGAVVDFLRTGAWPAARIPVLCEPPLCWAWPQVLDHAAPLAHVLLRTAAPCEAVALEASQDDRVLWRGDRRRLVPNRSIGAPGAWTAAVDPHGGPVHWRLSPKAPRSTAPLPGGAFPG
jgi:hypothetical protein